MLTVKQRAFLKALANAIEPMVQVGKDGLTDNALEGINALLEAREIVKIKVLKNSGVSPREFMVQILERLKAEPVQVIGATLVIFRRSTKKDFQHIELP